MITTNFKLALRNILKQKGYNLLNTIGLAAGLASGLIIALHIQSELSYDKAYPHHENIYRLHLVGWAKSSPTMGREAKAFFPEIKNITRFAYNTNTVVTSENKVPGQEVGYFADSSALKLFGLKVLAGDMSHLLVDPNGIVITKHMAEHFFGETNPIGQPLTYDGNQKIITAVIQDLPKKTHLGFDFLAPMPDLGESRDWMVTYTYVELASQADFKKIESRLPAFIARFYEGSPDQKDNVQQGVIRFQPLDDIHLGGNAEQELSPNGSILYIYILMGVEALILIVASANFMSLFTTQAIKRMKEVGMRKILGAKPVQLMTQTMTEVVLLTFISLIIGFVLFEAVLPLYNNISGNHISTFDLFHLNNLGIIGLLILAVVVVAGLYPALFIARFRAASFLREGRLPNSIPNLVRNGLVVFQFVVSIFLIASTILLGQQMHLIQNMDLGFDKDQVVNVNLYGDVWVKATHDPATLKHELTSNPDILEVGRAGRNIGEDMSVESVLPQGTDPNNNDFPSVRVLRVDEGYLPVMGIPLVSGRNFSTQVNDSSSFILNETAVKALRLQDPIGKQVTNVSVGNITGPVIGVVKDYHFASLHSAIEPLALQFKPEWTGMLAIRIKAGKAKEAIPFIQSKIKAIDPNGLFVYSFLDDTIEQLYQSENNMGKVFEFFSLLAIVIACLGLFGLSAHTIESRTKEIGIRKALGATVAGILAMISSRFGRLVILAFIVAVPATWYAVDRWLDNFAYKIQISVWVFAATGLIVLLISALAIGFNTIAAATTNPVKSLRYE